MGNFDNNRSDRGRTGYNRGSDRPQMNQATCSKCGKPCFVPFKPTGNRPIFCRDCFRTEGAANMRRPDERNPQMSTDRRMYDAICHNCGNRCQVPFQPREGKRVFCSHCFEQKDKEDRGIHTRPQKNEQFAALNAKLDKILQLLSPKVAALKVDEKVAQEVISIEKIEDQKVNKTDDKAHKKTPAKSKAASKK